MDSKFWDEAWQQERKKTSLYREGNQEEAWKKFWDQFAPTYRKIHRALLPSTRQMVEAWREAGLVDGNSRVLDIGCGPGTFTLPLAEAAGEVTGLDMSPVMLEVLDEEAREAGVRNIKTVLGDWRDFSDNQAYDLVLAANVPAICSRDTLLKLNAVSRKYALLLSYAGKTSPTLRHTLWKVIMGEPMEGKPFDISYPFNILYLEGFFPYVSFQGQQYRYQEKRETIYENFRRYFKIFKEEGPEVERALEKVLAGKDSGGFIEEEVSYTVALLRWDVRGEV